MKNQVLSSTLASSRQPAERERERSQVVIALGEGERGRALRALFAEQACVQGESLSAWARRVLCESVGHADGMSLLDRVVRLEREVRELRGLPGP